MMSSATLCYNSREGLERRLKSEIEFYLRKMAGEWRNRLLCVGCNMLAIGTEQTLICSFCASKQARVVLVVGTSRDKVWNEIDNGPPG